MDISRLLWALAMVSIFLAAPRVAIEFRANFAIFEVLRPYKSDIFSERYH